MDAVLYAASNTAEDFPGGITGMAAALDKNKFSLAHELSATGTAKLGLADAVKMVRRSKDHRILNAFAAEVGAMVLLLPAALAVEGDDAMHLVSQLAGEFNDVVQSFVGAVADRNVSGNEIEDIRRQWCELQLVGQRVVAHAEALHEAGKPAHLRVA
jgi:hypothetical protein